MRPLLLIPAAALLLLLTPACQSPSGSGGASAFPTPAADWQTLSGQMQHVGLDGKSVIGDVVIRRSKQGDFQLSFASGPGFPLMRLWVSGTRGRAEGVMARRPWQGEVAKAPERLRGWFQLPKIFATKGHNRDLSVVEQGERFVFHFGA